MYKKAFTLIEVLVVIAVIALLLALLLPALRLAQDQAVAIICVNNLRQLAIAWFTYANENNDELVNGHVPMSANFPRGILWAEPPQNAAGNYTGGNVPGLVEDKHRGIKKGLLFPYTKDLKVYHCPGDGRIDIPEQLAYRSYSVAGGANGEGWANSYKIAKKLTEIRNPGNTYIFVEECDTRGWNRGSWVMNLNKTDEWVDPFAIWHNEKSTLGFADGHAQKHRWVDSSTIEAAQQAAEGNPDAFFKKVPPDEGEDFRYMKMGFPRADF